MDDSLKSHGLYTLPVWFHICQRGWEKVWGRNTCPSAVEWSIFAWLLQASFDWFLPKKDELMQHGHLHHNDLMSTNWFKFIIITAVIPSTNKPNVSLCVLFVLNLLSYWQENNDSKASWQQIGFQRANIQLVRCIFSFACGGIVNSYRTTFERFSD